MFDLNGDGVTTIELIPGILNISFPAVSFPWLSPSPSPSPSPAAFNGSDLVLPTLSLDDLNLTSFTTASDNATATSAFSLPEVTLTNFTIPGLPDLVFSGLSPYYAPALNGSPILLPGFNSTVVNGTSDIVVPYLHIEGTPTISLPSIGTIVLPQITNFSFVGAAPPSPPSPPSVLDTIIESLRNSTGSSNATQTDQAEIASITSPAVADAIQGAINQAAPPVASAVDQAVNQAVSPITEAVNQAAAGLVAVAPSPLPSPFPVPSPPPVLPIVTLPSIASFTSPPAAVGRKLLGAPAVESVDEEEDDLEVEASAPEFETLDIDSAVAPVPAPEEELPLSATLPAITPIPAAEVLARLNEASTAYTRVASNITSALSGVSTTANAVGDGPLGFVAGPMSSAVSGTAGLASNVVTGVGSIISGITGVANTFAELFNTTGTGN